MSIHTAFRLAFAAAALCAAGTSTAEAKPRRLVILDFDGPRALADSGRTAVVNLLGAQYDVVATKRWETARSQAARNAHGPQTWRKAARQSGVDAVIEGWIQDEGRHKVLTVQVRDASTGNEIDAVSVKLTKGKISDANTEVLRSSLDEVLEWVEGGNDGGGRGLPQLTKQEARAMLGAKRQEVEESDEEREEADDVRARPRRDRGESDERRGRGRDRERERDGLSARRELDRRDRGRDELDDGDRERDREDLDRVRGDSDLDRDRDREDPERGRSGRDRVAKLDPSAEEQNDMIAIFGPRAVETDTVLGKQATRPPVPTPRFSIDAGFYYGSRSLTADAENIQNVDEYGARSKGFQLHAAVYPFPSQKQNAGLHGLGFTASLYRSAGSEVGVDTEDTIGNYPVNQNGFALAAHYRQPLGIVTLDGSVGYGHDNYTLSSDTPLDVPDVQYAHLHVGGHIDLNVTERATIGVGGKYLYLLDNGDMSSLDWYGPGVASGLALDASFVIPLPRQLYVRGELAYKRIKTTLDGAGAITEEENVLGVVDSTMNGTLNVGIQF